MLLIIFMITAHAMEYGIEVDVPEDEDGPKNNKDLPVIIITKNGLVYLGKDAINVNNLAASVVREKYDTKKGGLH